MKYNENKKNRFLIIPVTVIIIGLLGVSGYLYKQLKDLKSNPSASITQEAAKKEADNLKAKVSKHISLPSETPVIGTVNDKEMFKDQPFFNGVENGDKLLIFSEARKAVIYREKDDKLINVGPIAVSSEKTTDNKSTDTNKPAQ
jgi:hypothetical protein